MKAKPKKLATIDDLKAAEYNPRRIKATNLKGLTHSLTRFGDVSGLVWNCRTGNLVAGHQRLGALKTKYGKNLSLSGDENSGLAITLKKGKKTVAFPIRVVDWDEKTEQAANIAANSPKLQGEFTDKLQGLLSSLKERDLALFKSLNFVEIYKGDDRLVPPEVPFSSSLELSHNYVVLYFDNEQDWEQAVKRFHLKKVKSRINTPASQKMGIGRVVRGKDFL